MAGLSKRKPWSSKKGGIMRGLILILLIAAFVLSPFGKSIRSGLIWQNFSKYFDTDTKKEKKLTQGTSYYRDSKQITYDNQNTNKSSRGTFAQLRNTASSEMKQKGSGYALSQQKAMNARDLNYGNTASLKQQMNENTNAFKQTGGTSANQSLSQLRTSMSRDFGF